MASDGELNYQTSELRVLFYCPRCTKIVKKILRKDDRVYTVDIDSKENKVVVMGNLDAEALLQILRNKNRSCELWSETKLVDIKSLA